MRSLWTVVETLWVIIFILVVIASVAIGIVVVIALIKDPGPIDFIQTLGSIIAIAMAVWSIPLKMYLWIRSKRRGE